MRRAVLLLFVAGLMCAQIQPPVPEDPHRPSGSIHGVVKDESSGAPLADFKISIGISLLEGDGVRFVRTNASALTDADGRYTIAGLAPGVIQVTAGANIARTLHLNAGQDLVVDFSIPGSPTISGRVLDGDNQPVVDAFVYVIQSQYELGALRRSRIGPKITAEDGTFTFDKRLEARRTYYLLVDRDLPAFASTTEPPPVDQREPVEAPTYYGDATSLEAATPLVLRPGEQREQLDIKLHKAVPYCVDGKVQVAGTHPTQSLAIGERALMGADLPRARPYSAEDGAFRVCGLAPGRYAVSTQDSRSAIAEFAIASADVHKVELNVDRATLHLQLAWDGDPPAAPKPGPPAPNPPPGWDGPPIPSADELRRMFGQTVGSEIAVNLNKGGNPTSTTKEAPFDGPFGKDLNGGDYPIEAHVVAGSYIKEVTYNGIAIPDGMLHLAPGTTGTLRVVAAQGSGTLACQVSDADGNPVPNATVVLVPPYASTAALLSYLAKNGQTDPDGKATLTELAPGKYRALAIPRSYSKIPEDLDRLVLALFKASEVEVAAKESTQVKLHVVPID